LDAIHQFIPSFAVTDAIGVHARQVRRLARQLGLASEIYCSNAHSFERGDARHYLTFSPKRSSDRTWLLYQLSTGSTVARFLRSRPEPKLLNYHNITPASLFLAWEPTVGAELQDGRTQLRDLAPTAELGIADSAFNQAELMDAGCASTAVAPVMVDLEVFDRGLDAVALDTLQRAKDGGGSDWLFVGRVAPHKCQHDVVKAFAAYRQLYDSKARLHLVGASSSHSYWTALERYVAALGLSGAVKLTGGVPPGALAAQFRAADVFVCLSEHEGFCVPLLEAMHHQLPIVAFDAAAVPETLADAGVLLADKSPLTVAAAVNRVLVDQPLRDALATAADHRLADFTLERSRARWVDVIERVTG
jgi:glycosyltransferase involved in cell wall biosynthesis